MVLKSCEFKLAVKPCVGNCIINVDIDDPLLKFESVSRNISHVVISKIISYYKCDINVLAHEISICHHFLHENNSKQLWEK